MLQPMQGVRVLEVAQFTFVPAAGAILADWGAEVIKVEHAERGDGQRGLTTVLGVDAIMKGSSFSPIFEGPNRGKRSVGLSLEVPEARDVLDELIKRSDVFITNFLPAARGKLRINLEDVRKVNPDIIYVRGSGFGARGPEANKGGYDMTSFWARGGSGAGATPAGADRLSPMPAGGYGDNIGGMTIAGGIAAALFARATTGETSVIDVSLLGVGAWATQFTANLALQAGGVPPRPPVPRHGSARNPLIGPYRTSDDKWILFSMLQPGRYWAEFATVSGHPELVTDERFDTVEKLMANAPAAGELVAAVMAEKTFDEWLVILAGIEGQWAIVQNSWEVANDPSLRANGMIASFDDADGIRRELITNPVQFDETPATLRRGPLFAEHTDEVLLELGLTDERLVELKIARRDHLTGTDQMAPATEVLLPEGDGPHPAVVLGAEAYGVNNFIRGIQEKLVGLGYAVAVPDYYHGVGPTDPENYDDFTEVIEYISRLDFTARARDLARTVDALRAMPNIDPRRVAVWGYCTGGTLAWLAACLRGDLAAAVLYFPSQPVFAELSPTRPVHPIDLLWQVTCPALFLYGDQDKLMSPSLLADMRHRIDDWRVDARIKMYPGAGHSFTCPHGPMRNAEADRVAWNDAITFLSEHMGA